MAYPRGARVPGASPVDTGREAPDANTESTRLANRAATLSFAAAFAVIVALVTLPTAFGDSYSSAARLAAGVPPAAAVLLVAWAARARRRWSAHPSTLNASTRSR